MKPLGSASYHRKPLAIDLYAGLGGWTEGLLAEGWNVVGFDIERHVYGEHCYPSQLVLQDVLTIHGRQFKDASLIVASPPCQEYSYMAMPWSRAKAIEADYKAGRRDVQQLTALFDACFRIQREASEAAGRHIPMVVENVRGAQKWVGRSRWNFGSFHLWGDVPALMPMPKTIRIQTVPKPHYSNGSIMAGIITGDGIKGAHGTGGSHWTNPHERDIEVMDCTKGANGGWFNDAKRKGGTETGRLSQSGSKSAARKSAAALIAKIPLTLSRHIAKAWYPERAA